MMNCAKCGTPYLLPFHCDYCGNFYCDEHKLPESHSCPFSREKMNVPGQAADSRNAFPTSSNSSLPSDVRRKHTGRNVAILCLALILLLTLGMLSNDYVTAPRNSVSNIPTNSSVTSSLASLTTGTHIQNSSTDVQFQPPDPDFVNGTAAVVYPSDYSTFASFALALINTHRMLSGLQNVTLSPIASGQQHANSMEYHGSLGHWDVQGYKPYMRYTMLGGNGFVEENVALSYCISSSELDTLQRGLRPVACDVNSIENSINESEWLMMYNDAVCCNNGHRLNILDPYHTRVSIGIAYNMTLRTVYFVQDFENFYQSLTTPSENGIITIEGNVTSNFDLTPWLSNGSGALVAVYYDPKPAVISGNALPSAACLAEGSSCEAYQECGSLSELNETTACTYWGAYDSGTYFGSVFGPCPSGIPCSGQTRGGGTAVFASRWQVSNSSYVIVFSLSTIIHEEGVYTLYLIPYDSKFAITSFSVFIG